MAVPCPTNSMPQVSDGDGEAVLSMATLRQRFANPQELVGHSLYVSVTVLTESGVQGDCRGHRRLGGTGTAGMREAMGCMSLSQFSTIWVGGGHLGTCGDIGGWGQQ